MIFQFGGINNPFGSSGPFNVSAYQGTQGEGLFVLLNNLLKFTIVIAGLYAFWNIIAAGYMFMSAGGDAKAVGKAWDKIWQSLVGLLIVAGSFVLAAVFGWLIFKDPSALITPRIFTP
jgi:hypothetical protein